MPSTDEVIHENLAGPKKVTVDGVSFEQHSLADQIAADKHLAAKKALKGKRRGLLTIKMGFPGATD